MLQQFFAWIKSLFSKSSPIHHEDNGLWWQQTGTIVKVGLSTEIIKELATITFQIRRELAKKLLLTHSWLTSKAVKQSKRSNRQLTGSLAELQVIIKAILLVLLEKQTPPYQKLKSNNNSQLKKGVIEAEISFCLYYTLLY